ncbi:MAG: ATP phosphoribosyltransferase regulatory subunit [Clostridia bacterium]|jgi:ATP phosphoribosyltransferase regulatory subunit|nr:ATP phosphoribosyltransferase regulatory subunit [Clostridia bacterium]MBT7122633.1 ATP phosphoribosyltransferase regulatory subunit [Clostridia bacterium]
MDNYKKHVPSGAEDCLPAECYIKRNIEKKLRELFIISGYDEIETPTYEFYDAFQSGVGSYMQESMVKFVDAQGRILVLRPDMTVPIARVAATKLLGGVKQLFYIQNSFATAAPAFGKAGEFTQAGIELIGESDYTADAEVIALAVKSLITTGLANFTIDIGQVAFFKALISELKLKDSQIDELRHAVDSKDAMAIEVVATKLKLGEAIKQKILALPNLFGDSEVFDKALALSDNAQCVTAVENLRNVYSLLKSYGLQKYVSVDFSMLHDIAYYSGIIFRGVTPGIGFPIVSGGRYDELLSKFGDASPATGFALGIKRIMIALERQELLSGTYDTFAVVSSERSAHLKAFEYAEHIRESGKRVILYSNLSKSELTKAMDDTGAGAAIYFEANGNQVVL